MELNVAAVNGKTRVGTPDVDVDLSVVIAIRDPERAAPVRQLYEDYSEQLDQTGLTFEFVFVIEGTYPELESQLVQLKEDERNVKVLSFARWYGHATVLNTCFDRASGGLLLTLPAYHQIEPEAIPSVISALDGNDMVVVRRSPRVDGLLTRIQVRAFHGFLRRLLGFDFHDLGCSVRLIRRKVAETLEVYGDQDRFLPVLASYYGFAVDEIAAPQTKHDTFQKHLSFRLYANRLLDLLSVFFLTKFTRKPLRFFGSTGLVVGSAGFLVTFVLTIQRLFMGIPLADKPIFLLGVLLIVLGTLLLALGLIGEMIIFTHAGDAKEYIVERKVN